MNINHPGNKKTFNTVLLSVALVLTLLSLIPLALSLNSRQNAALTGLNAVEDKAGVLSQDARQRLQQLLASGAREKKILVKFISRQPENIDNLNLAVDYQIRKMKSLTDAGFKNCVGLIYYVKDRKILIATNKDCKAQLEGILTDDRIADPQEKHLIRSGR